MVIFCQDFCRRGRIEGARRVCQDVRNGPRTGCAAGGAYIDVFFGGCVTGCGHANSGLVLASVVALR